jgi:hypothetical protein
MTRKIFKAKGRVKKTGSALARKAHKAVRKTAAVQPRRKSNNRQGKLGQVAGAMRDAVEGVVDTVKNAVTGHK